jgi:hypothetical protein
METLASSRHSLRQVGRKIRFLLLTTPGLDVATRVAIRKYTRSLDNMEDMVLSLIEGLNAPSSETPFLDWLIENWEEVLKIILTIIELIGGM